MTKQNNYAKFVHEYTDNKGRTGYAVAEWNEQAAEWQAPLDARTAKLTGCSAEFSKKLTGLGGPILHTRRQALRRARYLFGDEEMTDWQREIVENI